MMNEGVDEFIDALIDGSKHGTVDWDTFSVCDIKYEIMREINHGAAKFDPMVNSVREYESYFFKSGQGYVFLFNVFHGDPEVTSPDMDTESLMVKVSDSLPLIDITMENDEDNRLDTLKILAEDYIESNNPWPDALYDFFDRVMNEINPFLSDE